MRRASAFPLRVRFEVILMDHNYTHFGAESRSLRPHYTQLYTPPYDLDGCPPWRTRTRMHMGSLLTCRPRFSQVGLGRVDTMHAPHPLGNHNQFQGFVYVSIRVTLLFQGFGFNLARTLRVTMSISRRKASRPTSKLTLRAYASGWIGSGIR